MLSSTRCVAYVGPYYNENGNEPDENYLFTVYVCDSEDDTDVLDIRDFETKADAQAYADKINLTGERYAD